MIKELYEKHYFLFWYITGLIPMFLLMIGNGGPENLVGKSGEASGFGAFVLILAFNSAFMAFFVWFLAKILSGVLGLLSFGIKEENRGAIFGSAYLFMCIVVFILGSFN